ncbi:hypothetical protein OBBRIDRAFT_826013 [Obba rivulosa]|uniref:ARID domain-containing protein n=1 Tax=Obba rivulosa TaxID=1052685 RepID=A0A8E2ASY0_9APHY|nr:hypothetical protein OBBRIDRAFT_826013 [Obba rivulosa]
MSGHSRDDDNAPHFGYELTAQENPPRRTSPLPGMLGLSGFGPPRTLNQTPVTPIIRGNVPQAAEHLGQTGLGPGYGIPPAQQMQAQPTHLQHGMPVDAKHQHQLVATTGASSNAMSHAQVGQMLPPDVGSVQRLVLPTQPEVQMPNAIQQYGMTMARPPGPGMLSAVPSHVLQAALQQNVAQRAQPPLPGVQSQRPRVPPLTKDMFEQAYPMFCKQFGIGEIDRSLLQHHGKSFTLHALHTEVLAVGPYDWIGDDSNLWAIIGARLGFIRISATDSLPARAGPAVAEQLHAVYKRYLHQFDTVYIGISIKGRQEREQQRQIQLQANSHVFAAPSLPRYIGPVPLDHLHVYSPAFLAGPANVLISVPPNQMAHDPTMAALPTQQFASSAPAQSMVSSANRAISQNPFRRRLPTIAEAEAVQEQLYCIRQEVGQRVDAMRAYEIQAGQRQEFLVLVDLAIVYVQELERHLDRSAGFIKLDDLMHILFWITLVRRQQHLLGMDPPQSIVHLNNMHSLIEDLGQAFDICKGIIASFLTDPVAGPSTSNATFTHAGTMQTGVPIPEHPPAQSAGPARALTPSQFEGMLAMAAADAEDVKPSIKMEDD